MPCCTSAASTPLALTQRVQDLLARAGAARRQGSWWHEASGLHLLRQTVPACQEASVYRPLLCLVLQGEKQVETSERTFRVGAGQSLLVSHTLPVLSRITVASAAVPYVALVLPLDLGQLRALMPVSLPVAGKRLPDPFSLSLGDTDAALAEALQRYLEQCEDGEVSRRLLAPITRQEIHARLLMGTHAEVLRVLLQHDSTASRIFAATRDIESNLARPMVVGELAQRVGMSSSAFFGHFRAVTGRSPLQYQKDLRLLRARAALRSTTARVSAIAFDVGYESAAQFSREYARKFGRSPRQERQRYRVD